MAPHSAAQRRSRARRVVTREDRTSCRRCGRRRTDAVLIRRLPQVLGGPEVGQVNGHLPRLQVQDGGFVDDLNGSRSVIIEHCAWLRRLKSLAYTKTQLTSNLP